MIVKEYLIEKFIDYNKRIDSIVTLFLSVFGVRNPAGLWRQGKIERVGQLLDGKIEYSFHGAGCIIEYFDGVLVSFDFNSNDTIYYTLFKFKVYLETLNEVDVTITDQDLEAFVKEALKEEDIITIHEWRFRLDN